jgi:hypothetical protein
MDFIPSTDNPKPAIGVEMPSNFISIILDFVNDLTTTFPEYSYLWDKWISKDTTVQEYENLFLYCMKVYPERFFDILYQNDEIFDNLNTTSTQFLPNVEFKMLFSCENITQSIKQTIWKYLQLILMTIMSSVKDKNDFGEAATMFDGIDENELQGKLNDTIESLGNFFKTMENQQQEAQYEGEQDNEGKNSFSESFKNMFSNSDGKDIPNANVINDHLKDIFNGKIGSLAKELADDLSGDIMGMLGGEEANIKDTGDIFKKLMKNPKKIIDLLKNVSGKLTDKMKSGNISQEDLMKEAGELMGKMKGMGGGSEFGDIIKNLMKNMGGLGGKGKVDTNALTRMSSQQSMRERMKAKLEMKKQALAPPAMPAVMQSKTTPEFILENKDTPNNFVFKLPNEEMQEKSVDQDKPMVSSSEKKKKKKAKK